MSRTRANSCLSPSNPSSSPSPNSLSCSPAVRPVLLLVFMFSLFTSTYSELVITTPGSSTPPPAPIRMVSWIPSSADFPLNINGSLMTIYDFMSYNQTNIEEAPQRIFLLLESWEKADMMFWQNKTKTNSTPAALSRLVGIVSGQASNYVCVYTHVDYYCPTKGCYPPTIVFFDPYDILKLLPVIREETGEYPIVSVTSIIDNEWNPFCDYNGPHQIFFEVISCLWYCVSIVISILLVLKMYAEGRLRTVNFAIIIISIEFAASILRIIGAAIDPYTFKHYIWLNVLHLSMGVITGILIIFVWQDITRRKKTNQGTILSQRFRTPAIVVVIVVSALALVSVIIPYVTDVELFIFYAGYCIAVSITYLVLAIFYFVTSSRVFKMLESVAENSKIAKGEASPVDVRAMTIKMILSGIGMILTIVSTITLFFSEVAPNIFGFYCLNFSQGLSSIATLLVFLNDKKRTTSTNNSSNKQTSMGTGEKMGTHSETFEQTKSKQISE